MENRKNILMQNKSGFERISHEEYEKVETYAADYMEFLNESKIESLFIRNALDLACENGFRPYEYGMTAKPGDKLFVQRQDKSAILAVIGQKEASCGTRIVAAHVDCPRIDLKAYPLYEDSSMALFKTHYYGGVHKYQWLARPLSLIGEVYKTDGSKIDINIGEKCDEQVFVISDLLPHLAGERNKKNISEIFKGENLNPIVGLNPIDDKGDERIKYAVMSLLYDKYGITEADFQSAELSLVPSDKARDVGFDRSMIGAYGHDDRSCSYAALRAIIETDKPLYTSVCVLADKEEIGSEGVTGMKSRFFDSFMGSISGNLNLCYQNSFCFSGDVCAAFDPNFPDAFDKRNNAKIGFGVGVCKYTGRAGKAGSSDAHAATVSKLRNILDNAGVVWQMSELGKVDQGGGGTVACYLAERNIEVIDVGVPVLSMHAPFEVVSKLDCFMAYKSFRALFTSV